MYYYATTIRKCALPAFPHHYEALKDNLSAKYPRANFNWNYEGEAGLHMHGMIETPTKIYINKLHPGMGWNVDHQLVKSKSAWLNYIHSENRKEEDLLRRCVAEEKEFYSRTCNSSDYPVCPPEQGERVPFRDLDAQTYDNNTLFKHVNLFKMHPLGSASPTPSNI